MANINKAFIRWKEVIILTALIRSLLFIFSIFFTQTNTFEQSYGLFNLWIRWDGPHYIDIAKNWYQLSGEQALFIVFYPLYPLLVKGTSFLVNDFQISAVLTSLLLTFIAAIILFELALIDFNKKIALRAVWFLNIFPTAYFLQAPYTESLFLTTSLMVIYSFRKGFFIRSGLTGILATMTRVNGILLLPVLLMETKRLDRNLFAILLTPMGFLIYLAINYFTFGNPFHFSQILSSHWYKSLTWPWISIQNLINFYQNQTGDYYWLFLAELVTIFLLAITTILVYLKVRKSYGVYMLFNLLLFISTSFILSTPRYALVLFPIFILLALINQKVILALISVISLILLFLLTYRYTQGRWAF